MLEGNDGKNLDFFWVKLQFFGRNAVAIKERIAPLAGWEWENILE